MKKIEMIKSFVEKNGLSKEQEEKIIREFDFRKKKGEFLVLGIFGYNMQGEEIYKVGLSKKQEHGIYWNSDTRYICAI